MKLQANSITVVSPHQGKPVILLVEDDPAMMSLLRETCRMQNYEAREASTGRAALQLAADDQPDLVLLDWELPDISGIEVCQELRRWGLLVPIMMLTGRGDDRDVVTGLEHGADEYLIKPIRPRVLAARLAAGLRRTAGRGSTAEADRSTRLALLERVPIFMGLPSPALRRLAQQSVAIDVKAGVAVINQGVENQSLYVIESGSFQVSIKSPNGRVLPIAVLAEADFFGAASLLTGKAAAATAQARRDSSLVKISRQNLLSALAEGSPARMEFERVVGQRRGILEVANRETRAVASTLLVSFYSPKGGVGKTTLAVNVAATLARLHPGEVVLFDLSLPYNHAALLAQLAPTLSLARLADASDEFEQRLVSGLAYHRSGFFVLSSALSPEESDLITPALASRALDVMKGQFRFVIVDLGTVLTEVALSLLEQSQVVFVVASAELLIVKDLISFYGILRSVLNLSEERIHLVLNHRARRGNVGRREIQELLGISTVLEIPHDGRRPETAALRGDILALSASRSPIAKAATNLASIVVDGLSN